MSVVGFHKYLIYGRCWLLDSVCDCSPSVVGSWLMVVDRELVIGNGWLLNVVGCWSLVGWLLIVC